MNRTFLARAAIVLAIVGAALPARAQDQPDPAANARIQIGPLALNPTVGIKDVGVDTNVFNEWDNPKQDFTATIVPGTDIWFRAGRSRLTGRANLGYMYFQRYGSQRSLNGDVSGRYEVDLFHVRPYVLASYLTTRDRPGFEIDVRARRSEQGYGFGADVAMSRRTTLGFLAQRKDTSYGVGEVYLGSYLREALDRHEDTLQAAFGYKLTPLTTLKMKASAERSRFTYSPRRNTDAVRVTPGVEFDAFAIVQGSAYVGVRKVDMLGAGIPSYTGPVADVNLGYTLLGATYISAQVNRDVAYSFDDAWSYYLLTSVVGAVTRHIAGPFDVQLRGGRQNLDYPRIGRSDFETGRQDVVRFFGGGVGYRFGRSARLGFNVDSCRRQSQMNTREYKGLRVGTSVTYGL